MGVHSSAGRHHDNCVKQYYLDFCALDLVWMELQSYVFSIMKEKKAHAERRRRSTCPLPGESHENFPPWLCKSMSSAEYQRGTKAFCVWPPPTWNQLPVELRTIESFSCLKRSLKQCLVMTRSCRDCSNWCYSHALWVSCVFMCLRLSQVTL